MLDLIIKNGQCYIDGELKDVDVSVKDGKIQNIGKIAEEAKDTIDAKGLTVLPGCIDTQTHFREPGSTDTEDLHSGSRAAIAGGITLSLIHICRCRRRLRCRSRWSPYH